MEWSFFVTAEALRRLHPAMMQNEARMLDAFDSNREHIRAVAAKLYAHGRKGCYELDAGDV
jgi:hypothetical protein